MDDLSSLAAALGVSVDTLPRWDRAGPVSILLRSREEEGIHIHVQSAHGEAKVWIEPQIELARNYELGDQDLRRVLQLVADHDQEIRDAWHGPLPAQL